MNHDHSNGMGKHMLLMLICCLVPLALILAVSVFGLSLGALTPLIPYALALMCPLMMIFMMRGMMQGQDANHAQHHIDAPRTAPRIASSASGAIETTAPDREQCH